MRLKPTGASCVGASVRWRREARVLSCWHLPACLLMMGGPLPSQPRYSPSCQVEIVSSTAIATICGHAADDGEALDLFIVWRGTPGWFEARENILGGREVVRDFATGKDGRVAQYRTYANVTVGFDADFGARTVRIDGDTLSLTHNNTIVVDDVDAPHLRRISNTFRVETALLSSADPCLTLARKSARVRTAFQCTSPPLPAPRRPSWATHQQHVTTVRDRLRQ